MRVVVIIVCIAVGYYLALYLISELRRHARRLHGEYGSGFYGHGQDSRPGGQEPIDREEQYRRLFGITEKDGPGDIKKKYKELLSKYHPDKVQHLGVEFQEMAADKTKKILEAYEFFRKKYHI